MSTLITTITRFRGDTYPIKAELSTDGVPVDFTVGNNTAKLSYATGSARTTVEGYDGTVDGTVSFPVSADVNAGTYVYDIQVTANTGEIRTYVKDVLTIVEDIS